MCYSDNARPPHPPGAAGQAHGEDLVLTAADGNRFAAYAAHPDGPSHAQIIIYPDVRGLHGFYRDLALRFAAVGVRAVAWDYFGRSAGLSARDDLFEFWPHVQQIQPAGILADVTAVRDHIRTLGGTAPCVVGFCMGGSLALITGTQAGLDLAGIIAFYAGLSRDLGGGTVLDQAAASKYPVLGLFGGADPGIPPEQVQELDRNLDQAGVPHTIVSYPGAPHSFFDRKAVDFAAESADAWQRILHFIAQPQTVQPA